MLHHRTTIEPEDHYAVNVNGQRTCVLAQLQHVYTSGHCEQVRVELTADEVTHMARLLLDAAAQVGSEER